MEESQVIEALSALAHDIRLRIVRHLVKCGKNGDSAGAIGDAVGAAPSKVTFHMAALQQANLVTSERVSRHIIYRIEFDKVGLMLGYLMHDCCEGNKTVLSNCASRKGKSCC